MVLIALAGPDQPLDGIKECDQHNGRYRADDHIIPITLRPRPVRNALQCLGLLFLAHFAGKGNCAACCQYYGCDNFLHGLGCFAFRNDTIFSTSSTGICFAWFPQLERSWLMMAAISSGVRLLTVPTAGISANSSRAL